MSKIMSPCAALIGLLVLATTGSMSSKMSFKHYCNSFRKLICWSSLKLACRVGPFVAALAVAHTAVVRTLAAQVASLVAQVASLAAQVASLASAGRPARLCGFG